ncbi:hypothetical protein J6590_031348 [Homalodisca vitripennis]|nr:hypothetical protein J6590_031348 [Homalodisca vitripennis]
MEIFTLLNGTSREGQNFHQYACWTDWSAYRISCCRLSDLSDCSTVIIHHDVTEVKLWQFKSLNEHHLNIKWQVQGELLQTVDALKDSSARYRNLVSPFDICVHNSTQLIQPSEKPYFFNLIRRREWYSWWKALEKSNNIKWSLVSLPIRWINAIAACKGKMIFGDLSKKYPRSTLLDSNYRRILSRGHDNSDSARSCRQIPGGWKDQHARHTRGTCRRDQGRDLEPLVNAAITGPGAHTKSGKNSGTPTRPWGASTSQRDSGRRPTDPLSHGTTLTLAGAL